MLRARSTTSVPTQLYYVPTPFYWINFQFFLKFTTNKEAHSALEKLQQSQMQLAVCTVNREGQPGHQLCFGKCRSCFTATQEDDWNVREHMFAQQTLIQCFTLPFMTHIAAIQERKKQMFSETSPWHLPLPPQPHPRGPPARNHLEDRWEKCHHPHQMATAQGHGRLELSNDRFLGKAKPD